MTPEQQRLMDLAKDRAPAEIPEELMHTDGDRKPYLAAGIIYVAPDGDILLLHRSKGEANYSSHWALPGGKAEHGEDAITAAEREAHEEVGVVPVGAEPVLVDRVSTPNGFNFHTFMKPVEKKFTPVLADGEHSGWCWAPLEMLPAPIHPGVKRVLSSFKPMAGDSAVNSNFFIPTFRNTDFFLANDELAFDPPVSEAQRRAMFAAKAGKSTIGIPQSVGKEFANADKGGALPAHAKDTVPALTGAANSGVPAARTFLKKKLSADDLAAFDAIGKR